MIFFVNSITSYSEKSNIINMSFIHTNTILDGCSINVYVPKKVILNENQENDIPYFICKGIFEFEFNKNKHIIKTLEKQIVNKAAPGKKRSDKKLVVPALKSLEKTNKRKEPEVVGTHLCNIGDKVILLLTNIQMCGKSYFESTKGSFDDRGRWRHEEYCFFKWRFQDAEGNIFNFNTSGKVNEKLLFIKPEQKIVVSAKIKKHGKYFENDILRKVTYLTSLKIIEIIDE